MKKTYFLATIFYFLILTACNKDDSLSANVVEDETFRSYLLQNFDTDKDGKFSKEEIAAAKTIDVSNRGITSIKGIEIFHAIETLKCNNNQIGEMELMENKQLIYLDCSFNLREGTIWTPSPSKLKYINSESGGMLGINNMQNPDLEYLNWSNTKQYDANFKTNSKLKYLDCSNSNICYFDSPNYSNIEYLDISQNTFYQETSIDISNNNKLKIFKAENTNSLKTIYLKKGQEIDDFKVDSYIEIVYK